MKRLGPFVIAAILTAATGASTTHADSTADCGRFFLKYNRATEKMECVGGKRAKPAAGPSIKTLTRQLRQSVQQLQQTLSGAEGLLRTEQVTAEQAARVRTLLNEARQRVEEVRRRTAELTQAQKSRTDELATEQKQLIEAQVQLAQELEQKQAQLTQQLLSDVRSRSQSIVRR